MNWEYYNQLLYILSPIHSYVWILYNSSSSNVEQLLLLGLLSFFTPSQITINITLTGIIFFILLRSNNWFHFAMYLSLIRFFSLMGGAMFLPLLDPFLYNFVTGFVKIAVGPLLLSFILFVFFRKNLSKQSYWLWTIGILVLFSLYTDPMMVSIYNIFLGEASFGTNLGEIGIYNFVILLPILIPFLIYYGFEIDIKLIQNKKVEKGLYVVISMLVVLVSINEIILNWS